MAERSAAACNSCQDPLDGVAERGVQDYGNSFGLVLEDVVAHVAHLLRPRCHAIIAQPGLQASTATDEQLLLLAGVEKFVRDTSAGDFTV